VNENHADGSRRGGTRIRVSERRDHVEMTTCKASRNPEQGTRAESLAKRRALGERSGAQVVSEERLP